jgi:DNA repair protein RadA/Sms
VRITHELTGIPELDRVLGGGLVPGSYLVLAGAPGAGKSTLATDLLMRLQQADKRVAYVSGEESEGQVKLRFDRLAAAADDIDNEIAGHVPFSPETNVERICQAISDDPYDLLVVDSVQTLFSEENSGAPGSTSQVRECGHRLMQAAKGTGTSVLLIGQVTKDGAMAGPRTLEHMVDVVLSFEEADELRVLRAIKNRFGAADEIGVFEMTSAGLLGVPDPSARLVPQEAVTDPGSAICAVMEGTRPILCEVQALTTVNDNNPMPTRAVNGLDAKRVQMLIAVLTRKLGYRMGSNDVFLSVGGGLKVDTPAADLAACLALASAITSRPVKPEICVFGEVNLRGEIRPVPQAQRLAREAQRLGYTVLDVENRRLHEVIEEALSALAVEEGIDGERVVAAA